ncbi:hypothetical protein ARTHRO8AJ_210022 [Arthrobacter sp. 8AJ]|nr:hypothetical protein ARTHRO8AJ_210022 [Arthrobacter sp. 8AJ]
MRGGFALPHGSSRSAQVSQHQPDRYADGDHHQQGPVSPRKPTGRWAPALNGPEHQCQRNNQQRPAGINNPRVAGQCPANDGRRGAVPGHQLRNCFPPHKALRGQEVLGNAQSTLCHSSDEHQVRSGPRPMLKTERTGDCRNQPARHNAQQRDRAESHGPLHSASRHHT